MPDERSSPSGGWREVYDAMAVDPSVEGDERSCPDCGRQSPHVFRTVYHCEEHGYWQPGDDERETNEDRETEEGTAN